jgi:hypothetical protein
MLHLDSQPLATTNGSSVKNNQFVNARRHKCKCEHISCIEGQTKKQTLLAIAIVEVKNKFGQYIPCRALLDSGSQSHFFTERCAQRLRLRRTQTHTSIQGI